MTESDPIILAAKAANMTDGELIAAWEALADPEVLDAWGQAVVDEMAVRELDF